MYKPENILTKSGFEEYKAHLFNIEKGLFFILNHADDLHIGAFAKGREVEETLYKMNAVLESKFLLNGDGETE